MKMLTIGTAALAVALGAGAAYASNPNVPSWSPYAIMGYDTGPTFAPPGHGDNPGYPPRVQGPEEGRAAYVGPPGSAPAPGYYPGPAPANSYTYNPGPAPGTYDNGAVMNRPSTY